MAFRRCRLLALCLVMLSFFQPVTADELMDNWGPHSVGAMHSYWDSADNSSFDQAEAFMLGNTPARWTWSVASLATQYGVGVGNLRSRGENATCVSAGVNFDLVWSVPFSLQLGIRPTWLDKSEFEKRDLGGNFFFNSQFGIYYYWKHLVVGTRINHISNAKTNKENPGIDFLSLELRYLFNLPLQLPNSR